jgi:hypothetical protein
MRLFEAKTEEVSEGKFLTYVIVSIDNCAPERRNLDYFTYRLVQAALAKGRNEVRREIHDALSTEREQ